jgi:hypothetical protein
VTGNEVDHPKQKQQQRDCDNHCQNQVWLAPSFTLLPCFVGHDGLKVEAKSMVRGIQSWTNRPV